MERRIMSFGNDSGQQSEQSIPPECSNKGGKDRNRQEERNSESKIKTKINKRSLNRKVETVCIELRGSKLPKVQERRRNNRNSVEGIQDHTLSFPFVSNPKIISSFLSSLFTFILNPTHPSIHLYNPLKKSKKSRIKRNNHQPKKRNKPK